MFYIIMLIIRNFQFEFQNIIGLYRFIRFEMFKHVLLADNNMYAYNIIIYWVGWQYDFTDKIENVLCVYVIRR